MGSRFEFCLQFTLSWEGGKDNDPHDPGGVTSYGIDQRDHPGINVTGLDLAGAKQIYFNENWLRFRCQDFAPPWDLLIFDSSVNPGQGRRDLDPHTWGVVNAVQECVGAKVDGWIGPKTIASANASVSGETIDCFISKRIDYYGHLRLSLRKRYMDGWMNRTRDLARVAKTDPAI